MSNNSPPAKNKKLNLIQLFRGLAAVLVALFHATAFSRNKFNHDYLFNIFDFGNSGIHFFFVLSGFIIFYIHRSEIGHRKKVKPFILKRLIRIYPIYWIITLTLVIIYFLVPALGTGSEVNIQTILNSLVLFPHRNPPILLVGWTLRHEILFYLMFSLMIVLKPKFSVPIIFSWLSVIFVLFITKTLGVFELKDPYLIQFLFEPLNLEFALGGLVAYVIGELKFKPKNRYMFVLLYTGIFLFLVNGLFFHQLEIPKVILYGILSTLIIMGSALIDIYEPVNISALFNYLGDASYSIFLTHIPVMSATIKLAAIAQLDRWLGAFLTMSLIIGISLGAGCIFYSYIEKPLVVFLRHKLLSKN